MRYVEKWKTKTILLENFDKLQTFWQTFVAKKYRFEAYEKQEKHLTVIFNVVEKEKGKRAEGKLEVQKTAK